MPESLTKKFHLKKPSATFLVCLGIAVLIWTWGRFTRYYTIKMAFRVEAVNIPERYPKTSLSDSVFTLTFRARGFDFLKSDFDEENRILQLPIEQLIKTKKANLYNYSFSKKELEEFLRDMDFHEDEFVEIEMPENLTVYMKK